MIREIYKYEKPGTNEYRRLQWWIAETNKGNHIFYCLICNTWESLDHETFIEAAGVSECEGCGKMNEPIELFWDITSVLR